MALPALGSNANPLFGNTPSPQFLTSIVTSRLTKAFALATETPPKSAVPARVGALLNVSVASFQDDVIRKRSNVPGLFTVFRKSTNVAFETWLPTVPAGSPERSNWMYTRFVTEPSNLRLTLPPKLAPDWAELVNESPIGDNCPLDGFGNIKTASKKIENT